MKKYSFFLITVLLQAGYIRSQSLSLDIYSYSAEKSRDSHSATEKITLKGNAAFYSATYKGRRGPAMKDEEKNCVLPDSLVNKINKIMIDKKLLVSDSLTLAGEGDTFSSVAIRIKGTKDKKPIDIKIGGSPGALAANPLYKNSLYLIYTVKNMIRNCK